MQGWHDAYECNADDFMHFKSQGCYISIKIYRDRLRHLISLSQSTYYRYWKGSIWKHQERVLVVWSLTRFGCVWHLMSKTRGWFRSWHAMICTKIRCRVL